MTKRHRRTKDNRMLMNMEPLGYYLVVDHNQETSVIRFYTEDEQREILQLSKTAQTECTKLHKAKTGKCCVLVKTTKEVWEQWH
jgi:hypothetical protein